MIFLCMYIEEEYCILIYEGFEFLCNLLIFIYFMIVKFYKEKMIDIVIENLYFLFIY